MNKYILEKRIEEMADEKLKLEKLYNANPLLRFSTSQLKAELKRRKKDGE